MMILKVSLLGIEGPLLLISKPRQGHIVSFDGCGLVENELIRSLKKAVEDEIR